MMLMFKYLSATPIDMAALLAAAHHPQAGAVVLFSGETRNSGSGKEVVCLDFEAYIPLAERMMAELLEEAKKRWNLHAAIAQHRTGTVAVMECAVVVITASAHRKEAYEANRYIIDRIKHELPIWKYEIYADGTGKWGGNCNCHEQTGDPSKHIYEFDATKISE
jgi:molybdopterin synthase catalytic subunit